MWPWCSWSTTNRTIASCCACSCATLDVVEAANGERALEVIEDQMPDLVITDLRMPVMDGGEFVRRLRADERTAGIRVLVWSADPDRDLPVDAIVPKPYGGDALVRHVTQLLEG